MCVCPCVCEKEIDRDGEFAVAICDERIFLSYNVSSVCVCQYICVCVRERKRERWGVFVKLIFL